MFAPPARGPALALVFRLIQEKDVVTLEDMFSRKEVDVISGMPGTLVTGLMKACSVGLPQIVKVRFLHAYHVCSVRLTPCLCHCPTLPQLRI